MLGQALWGLTVVDPLGFFNVDVDELLYHRDLTVHRNQIQH